MAGAERITDTFSGDEEDTSFFDAMEHIAQESESVQTLLSAEYDLWTRPPQSVKERRMKFIRWMGLTQSLLEGETSVDSHANGEGDACVGVSHRVLEDNGAVLRSSINGEELSSTSSLSGWNTFSHGNSNGRSECGMAKIEKLREVRLPGMERLEERETEGSNHTPRTLDQLKNRWLRKWRSITCMVIRNVKDDRVGLESSEQVQNTRVRRVRARHFRKKLKELSALFTGQDIQAHEGSILSMKFSLDGQYLASAGEDKIVRVWQVMEDGNSDTLNISDVDHSCIYFSMNHLSKVGPLMLEKDNIQKTRNLRITQDSACVVFPPNVFRILEKPVHVFQGHSGEILDLSWSKSNCLLSSSADKTVRLWRVGVDRCLKVFSHTDYVTCIQFNPVNDDYFISGSIDGKIRIWTISGCQVSLWTEMKDIITAISYSADGQGGITGSISGTCRFFRISDGQFQLENQVCLTNKKKPPCRRITGLQFLSQDSSKVLVTCADSQVRIIDGVKVIAKYKGLRKAGCHISASLTPNGKHIISASEDSNIYFWNYTKQEDAYISHPKVIRSFEFLPFDASIAVPWPGMKCRASLKSPIDSLPFPASTCFSLSQDFLLDANSKGSATWPEEKLPTSSPKMGQSSLRKSEYKLFKTACQSSSITHACGLVFVTASWDGRIRSFHNYGLPVPL